MAAPAANVSPGPPPPPAPAPRPARTPEADIVAEEFRPQHSDEFLDAEPDTERFIKVDLAAPDELDLNALRHQLRQSVTELPAHLGGPRGRILLLGVACAVVALVASGAVSLPGSAAQRARGTGAPAETTSSTTVASGPTEPLVAQSEAEEERTLMEAIAAYAGSPRDEGKAQTLFQRLSRGHHAEAAQYMVRLTSRAQRSTP